MNKTCEGLNYSVYYNGEADINRCDKQATRRYKETEYHYVCEDHMFEIMDSLHADSGSSNPDYNQEDYIDQFEELVGESNEERI